MPKQFYTEHDIEDMVRSGVKSLQVTDDVVLTELAYEKAKLLDFRLVTDRADNPPAAPVRPYLSEKQTAHASRKPVTASVAQADAQSALTSAISQGERGTALEKRIHDAVTARLGNQVDSGLLDAIIKRVLKATGMS